MTPAQLATLKAAALADPTALLLMDGSKDVELADWFNTVTTHIVWRSVMTPEMARVAITEGSAQLDALTVGKRDSLFWLCEANLTPSNPVVRAAIDDLCGTQNILKSALLAAQKRPASRAEKVLASGTGTTASPATLTFEGAISYSDASLIRS